MRSIRVTPLGLLHGPTCGGGGGGGGSGCCCCCEPGRERDWERQGEGEGEEGAEEQGTSMASLCMSLARCIPFVVSLNEIWLQQGPSSLGFATRQGLMCTGLF